MRFKVGLASEIPPGGRKIVRPTENMSIGVFNVNGEFFALKNTCPHQGAPLCEGRLTGTSALRLRENGRYDLDWNREGEIISCPWHHWQFDLLTGATVFPSRDRVATYDVTLSPRDRDLENDDPGKDCRTDDVGPVQTFPVTVEEHVVYLELPSR